MSHTPEPCAIEVHERRYARSVLMRPGLALVCFADPWSEGIRAALDALASRWPSVRIVFVDFEQATGLRSVYGFRESPTTLIVRDGVEIGRLSGLSWIARLDLALESANAAPAALEQAGSEALSATG